MDNKADALREASRNLGRLLVGNSAPMAAIRRLVAQVAPSDASVLILGESGTGKEVVARGVHDLSGRAKGPFVPVNCGAIPAELLESELFGHEKGAFTGAINTRQGRFELAGGGTLFLDEIGDMPLQMQVKLLRVLQERCFERVGSNRSQACDVRVIAATHQDLEQQVEAGHFRMDLFYRLNVFPIDVPPLRDRVDDIPALTRRFIELMERDARGSVRFADDAIAALMRYSWPGNVRELANLVERMAILYPDEVVSARALPPKFQQGADPAPRMPVLEDYPAGEHRGQRDDPAPASPADSATALSPNLGTSHDNLRSPLVFAYEPDAAEEGAGGALFDGGSIDLKTHLADLERSLMVQALEQSDWVVARAAKMLSLQRTTLVEKMRKYDIVRPEGAPEP